MTAQEMSVWCCVCQQHIRGPEDGPKSHGYCIPCFESQFGPLDDDEYAAEQRAKAAGHVVVEFVDPT